MREIKFRAWDNMLNNWNKDSKSLYYEDWGKYFGFLSYMNGIVMVEQFTGLKDKNGKEIYEGDIVQSKSKLVSFITGEEIRGFKIENYEVRWEREKGRWGRYRDGRFELLTGLNEGYLKKWYMVIGNIHENPELLKEPDK